MLAHLFWFVVLYVGTSVSYKMFPGQRGLIMTISLGLFLMQLYAFGLMLYHRYKSDLEVNELVREADDAMEEAMRDDEDNSLLKRYEGLSTKKEREMNADELLAHARQLHGQHKP